VQKTREPDLRREAECQIVEERVAHCRRQQCQQMGQGLPAGDDGADGAVVAGPPGRYRCGATGFLAV